MDVISAQGVTLHLASQTLSRDLRWTSPQMVAAASRLNRTAEGRLTVREGDAATLPLPDASVDAVYCLNAFFFFFPDPAAAMAEMARILRPGGRIAIITAPPEWKDRISRISPRMATAMRFDPAENLSAWGGEVGLHDVKASIHAQTGLLFVARR